MALVRVLPWFALTALVLAMVPGQGMAMIMRQTMMGGARTGYLSVAGNTVGLLCWGALSSVGLSQIFAHSPLAYNVLKYLGVGYLSYLGLTTLWTLRRGVGAFDPSGQATTSPWAAFRLGLLTNLTNVKACVFAVAFIPQFVPTSIPLSLGIVALSITQACVSTLWYTTFVASVDRAARLLARPSVRLWLTAVSAAGLLTLAGVLLVSSSR
jgi:threonine/homoserine/homoserine lactone efflux protein